MRDKVKIDDNQIEIAQKIFDVLQDIAYKEPVSLETTINHDLMIYGDDFDDLAFNFDSICDINWENFEFTRHMINEGDWPFILPSIILGMIKFLPYIILLIFNKEIAKKFWDKTDIIPPPNKNLAPLYVSDIIVSAIKGRFEYAENSEIDIEDIKTRLQYNESS